MILEIRRYEHEIPNKHKTVSATKAAACLSGQGVCKNRIDGENVIYRDLGDYDIEISGCHTKNQPVSIYVWEKKEWVHIVETHTRLPQDYEQIKRLLDDIVTRYSKKEDEYDA